MATKNKGPIIPNQPVMVGQLNPNPIIPGQGVMAPTVGAQNITTPGWSVRTGPPPPMPRGEIMGPPSYDPIAAQVSMARPTVTQQSADQQTMPAPAPTPDPYVALLTGINQRVRDRAGFYQKQIQSMAKDTQLPDAYKAVFQSSAPAVGNAAAGYADALTGSQAVLPHIYDLIDSYRAKIAADQAAAQQQSQDASLSMLEQFANGDTKKK